MLTTFEKSDIKILVLHPPLRPCTILAMYSFYFYSMAIMGLFTGLPTDFPIEGEPTKFKTADPFNVKLGSSSF